MLKITVLGPRDLLFDGDVSHAVFPGERGVFEVWPFHRPLVSRLLPGVIVLDDRRLPIQRGVVQVARDTVTAFVEPREAP